MTVHRPARFVVLALLAALVLGACGAQSASQGTADGAPSAGASLGPASLPLTVSVTEAAAMRDAGALVLDVREPDEWVAGHIPGAALIPLGELAARVAEVPRDRDVVVVCRSGNRSAQGRDILLGAGYTSVTSMAGGMNDWAGSGRPVVEGP